jgi:hypothetical protein
LTGFNHYPDCTCGWCVNYGRMSGSERRRLESDMRRRDAMRELKLASARSITGCYVNPNAKCPVCGAGVFFYANEHGSRVVVHRSPQGSFAKGNNLRKALALD